MSDPTKCPRCGGELPANFPPGVCPACLLKQGLSPDTYISGAGSASNASSSGRRNRWTPPTPAELASRFPQLEIVELLGQGGMGAVYKVRQKDLDRWAALKILPDDVAQDPNFAERFQREARALALLGHQNIVIVYEFGQRDGVYFLLMEYVDGVNLRQAIRAGQILAKDALGIVTQVCDALQFAHEEGVVHRDIKPENILIDKRGRVKIADFGLAKLLGHSFEVPTLTGTHQVIGTPVYMAPEQMEGTRGVDHRADIFSLGVVFYELLTGELPLGRFAPPSQKYSLDVRLDEVVLRTLEKEPDRRYQQASEVKGDVESIRSQPTVAASAKPKRSRPGLASKFLFVVVPLVVAGFAVTRMIYMERQIRADGALMDQRMRNLQDMAMEQQRYVASTVPQQVLLTQSPKSIGALIDSDPNVAYAIVQFVNGQAKLNPDFGTNVLLPEQRFVINQILDRIHASYLQMEWKQFTHWKFNADGSLQVTVLPSTQVDLNGQPTQDVIELADEVGKLENDLWTQIDSQIPLEQQRFLRKHLPLFGDDSKPLPLVADLGSTDGGGGGSYPMMGMAAAPAAPMSGMSSMAGLAPAFPGVSRHSGVLKYEQLLGWKLERRAIRIVIARRGNWFRWSIQFSNNFPTLADRVDHHNFDSPVEQGDDPELPSGLRRFWTRAVIENTQSRPETRADFPSEKEEMPDASGEVPIGRSQLRPSIPSVKDLSISVGATDSEGPALPIEGAPVSDPLGPRGTKPQSEPVEQVNAGDSSPPKATFTLEPPSLAEKLHDLDNLRAGAQTPWAQVEKITSSLLREYSGRDERGQIYSMAAHVYAQSDIRGHATDVTRLAQLALKYQLDPVQRGRLYLYLGNAAEVRDNDPKSFLESRAEATTWYLKGYVELQVFQLPAVAPELPTVEKIGESIQLSPDGGIDPDTASLIVRHEAQMKARREAETIRELVQFRDFYLGRLKELFGRLHQVYDKDAEAPERFRQVASSIIKDLKQIGTLMEQIFPEKQ